MLNFISKTRSYSLVFVNQAIVSSGNFIVTIIILRFLGIEIFGLFSFLWLFLLLINAIQISYIISPMLTNAPKKSASSINSFYGGVFNQQLIFTTIIFFIIYLVLKFFGNYIASYQIEKYYLSFPLLIVVTQLHQFLRRLLFSKKLYLRATLCDFITYFSLISFMIYLKYVNELSLETVVWSFVFAFTLGTIIILPIIFSLNYKLTNTFEAIKENWVIAKWMLLTSLLQWFSGNLWVVNAGLILGPYMLGVIRACQTLLNISNIIFQSIENIIPRETSKKFNSGGTKEMQLYLKKFTQKGFIIITLITLLIMIFAKFLLNIFYGVEIASYYQMLIFISIIIPINFLQYAPTYGLRTLGKTKPIFISFLFSSIFSLLTSKLIITHFDIEGFIFGLYATQIIIVYTLYTSYLKKLKTGKV
jgi:O-antigen/teichoic acid export membrane protein